MYRGTSTAVLQVRVLLEAGGRPDEGEWQWGGTGV
eukprot:SAG11_NODE_6280_length_1345_cov_0.861156_1_plen_34_part_10